ncbi:MAG TPA: hypothetical protein DCL35_03060, partial [Candidatus Omnitrophica bacterium]|nr:hypothetical protein [Candidatus Omnitrophota bacterium]
ITERRQPYRGTRIGALQGKPELTGYSNPTRIPEGFPLLKGFLWLLSTGSREDGGRGGKAKSGN